MVNKIRLKRTSTPSKAPTTSNIEVGEVAMNMADRLLYYRDGADNIKNFTITQDDANPLIDSRLSEGTGINISAGTIDVDTSVIATQSYVDTEVSNLVNSSPSTLDTLNELAEALGDDPNFATTVANDIGTKVSKAGDTMSGNLDMGGNNITSAGTVSGNLVGNVTGQVSDISNHSTTDLSEGTNLYYTDARARNAVSASTGIDYSSTTGVFSLSDTTVSAGTFGSASEVPVITVDAQGRITSASTTNVAGVSSFSYNSTTGNLDIGTADGSTFTATVDLGPFTTSNLSEGSNLYYTDTRARNALGASGDLNYNSTTGQFSVTTYKSSDFDTDFDGKSTSDLSEGTNLYYTDTRANSAIDTRVTKSFVDGLNVDFNTLSSKPDPTITLAGDLSGSVTLTNLGNGTLTATIADDSHNHVIGNIDGLQNALDNKADDSTTMTAGAGLTGGGSLGGNRTFNVGAGTGINVNANDIDVDTSVIATRSYVNSEVSNLVNSAPSTLDTLNELAAALGDDPNFATTVANDIGTKANNSTTISAGSGLTGGGSLASNRTISHADTSSQGSVNNGGGTVIQDISLDGFGHITNINSNNLDTRFLGINDKADDANLLDGLNSSQFLRSDTSDSFTTLSGTEINLGNGVELRESSDRADLLQIRSSTSSWSGLQIYNSSDGGRFSFMADGNDAGIYDDANSDWHIKMHENAQVELYHNGSEKLQTTSGGIQVIGVVDGTATSARYADLAENYAADALYQPGTVVAFGGTEEVTVSDADGDSRIAGVISTNPAHLMNSHADSEYVAAVALTGRVPTRVSGNVRKGDMMVSNGDGTARAESSPAIGTVIGKALENFDGDTGVIEVVVGRL